MEMTLTNASTISSILPTISKPKSNPQTTTKKRRKSPILLSNSSSSSSNDIEIRVCVNRTCNKQGSRSILGILTSIAPPNISVNSCGCLGQCGAGPNIVLVPQGSIIGHCGTTARAARVMQEVCGKRFDAGKSLEALRLRNEAEEETERRNFDEADALLSKAIQLEPAGGMHLMYTSRSVARLGKGDDEGALADAQEACRIAPKCSQGYICQGDAYLAMEDWDSAEKAYSDALQIDSSIRRSKSFKARVVKLQEKLLALSDASP